MKKQAIKVSILSCCLFPYLALPVYADNNSPRELPTITVQANKEYTYPGGYVNRTANIGTLGKLDFMNSPTNTISFSEKIINQNKQPTREFFDVVTNSPSVQVGGCSTDNNVELQIRGVEYNLYDVLVDGLPGLMPMGSNSLNWAKSVEVSIGGNSSLNGVSPYRSATGYINMIPKTATNKDITTYTQSFSGKSIHTETIDLGRRFGNNNQWGIRINGMFSNGETSINRDKIKHNNIFIDLDNKSVNHNTNIFMGYEKVKHTGMPEVLLLKSNVWGHTVTFLPNPSTVEDNFMPDWSILSRTRKVFMIKHIHKLSQNWEALAAWGYQSIDYPGYLDGKPYLLNDNGDYSLSINGNYSQSKFLRHSLSLQVNGNIKTNEIKHHLTFGYDRLTSMNEWSNGSNGTQNKYKGNIYNNKNINSFIPPVVASPDYYAGSDDLYKSFYISDYMLLNKDRLNLTLGLRNQSIDTMKYNKQALTPVVAFLYHLNDKTSIYGSYGDTLDVAIAPKDAKNAREALPPYHIKQYELGIKYDFGKLATTLDVFRLTKPEGIYDTDKTYKMDGSVEHRGLEVNVFGKIAPRVNLQGGVMFLDSNLKEMSNPLLNGKKAFGTSPFNATLNLEWQTPKKGLSVDGRVLYMGPSYADALNHIKVPGWTRFDLGATYTSTIAKHNYTLRANIYNLFNKKYWSTTVVKWGESGLMLNPGRNFYTSFSIDF